MPKTPPTIIAPLPNDPRVMALAKSVSLTRREAFAAAAEAWAWMSVMAVDDIVVNTAADSLDGLVDVAGFGAAMLQAGLVGVVNDGLVLPAELRRRERNERGGRIAHAEDQDDKVERARKNARVRQRRRRAGKALTKPTLKPSPSPTAEDTGLKRKPHRLGDVDGFPVMLLWGSFGPFYKLAGASPKEWTGTATDPERPSFADALVALHAAMKREDGKGLGSGDTFRPSLQAVVTAAERYRQERQETAAAAARRDEGNRALAEASAEDQDNIDHEPAERDCHAPVTVPERDTVTVTLSSRSEGVTCPPNSSGEADLENADCHARVTAPAPSSSSSSVSSGNEEKKNTTTTSSVTPRQRDHEDDILDRFVPRKDPVADERKRKQLELAGRFAAGLGVTVESILQQWRYRRDTLLARLLAAGIDPNTGLRIDAGASDEAAQARADIDMTTEPTTGDKGMTVNVGARGENAEFACSAWELRKALHAQGIPLPSLRAPPAEDDACVSVTNC